MRVSQNQYVFTLQYLQHVYSRWRAVLALYYTIPGIKRERDGAGPGNVRTYVRTHVRTYVRDFMLGKKKGDAQKNTVNNSYCMYVLFCSSSAVTTTAVCSTAAVLPTLYTYY